MVYTNSSQLSLTADYLLDFLIKSSHSAESKAIPVVHLGWSFLFPQTGKDLVFENL